MELWIQNDGFVHRTSQLSQDTSVLEENTLKVLRNDLKREKALDIVNTMFLSALQFTIFNEFDPRGDETLVAVQERLAKQYLPKGNMPDPSDLSPLLAIFQEHGMNQSMSAYGPLWSELLSCMVYETFQNTDLRDRDKVHQLGRGVRDLFTNYSDGASFVEKVLTLCCANDVSSAPLVRVYRFDKFEEDEKDDDEEMNQND
jgi:Zn-dependent oligopeptidase